MGQYDIIAGSDLPQQVPVYIYVFSVVHAWALQALSNTRWQAVGCMADCGGCMEWEGGGHTRVRI